MRIFVYEFITGGGLLGQALPQSLAREGDMMLNALVDDLTELPGIEVLTSRDPRLEPFDLPVIRVPVAWGGSALEAFQRGVRAADAVWPIAPESGGTLEKLSWEVLRASRVLLGSRPHAVRQAASKLFTARRLARTGIPVVPTYADAALIPDIPGPWVIKPDDGAGCSDTRRLPDAASARAWLESHPGGRWIAQPWLAGEPLSLSLICADGRARLLCCNRQHIGLHGESLVLEGVTVNALQDTDGGLAKLGQAVAAAFHGLWGYVGVDFILNEGEPVILEVNPRLTTSYCGLKKALGFNPAAQVMALARRGGLPPSRPRPSLNPVVIAMEAGHGL